MTHSDLVIDITSEVEAWLRRLGELRVHDDRIRGQLEVLRRLEVLLANSGPKARPAPPQARSRPPQAAPQAKRSHKKKVAKP